jgi:hypothetical protein
MSYIGKIDFWFDTASKECDLEMEMVSIRDRISPIEVKGQLNKRHHVENVIDGIFGPQGLALIK